MKTCNICGEQFKNGRVYSNHVRWKHKVKKVECKFCGEEFSCGIKQHESGCLHNPVNIRYCKQCGEQILSYEAKLFCSHSCSATYTNKTRKYEEIKSNCLDCGAALTTIINKKMYCRSCLNRHNGDRSRLYVYDCDCEICGKKFKHETRKVKTCSKECYSKLLSNQSNAHLNCGGETNYKKYCYKGIYMDSTWELEIAKWMDENDIEWQRSRKIMFRWTDKTGTKRRYYPDFYLPTYDLYLDPKNKYLVKQDKFKLQQVIRENKIDLIYGDKDIIIETIKNMGV